MKTSLRTLMIALFAIGGASSAFAFHPDDVATAAGDFSRAATHFQRVVQNVSGFSHLAQDVARLAQSAAHFQRAVAGGADEHHARQDFQRIRTAFHHVQRAVQDAHQAHHNPHVIRDFYRVHYTFEDLEYAME